MTILRSGLLGGLATTFFVMCVGRAIAADDDKKEQEQQPATEAVDRYALPEGGVTELLKFIDELEKFRPQSREEFDEFQKKGQPALREAAEKVLSLETDKSSAAFGRATEIVLRLDVQSLGRATADEAKAVLERVSRAMAAKDELSRNDLSMAFMTASTLERSGKRDLALAAYKQFGGIFSKLADPSMARYGEKMFGSARRMNLLGKEMKIKGKLVDGSEFNWKSYRGKVVLVDFWATWCGPCIAELPNVKKAYAQYHEKGFDVVGISLDSDRKRLEKFLQEKATPWVCLFEDEAAWDHPMATYYGIMGIPSVILVDQEGKVVSLRARGPELGKELEKLLGPAEEQPSSTDTEEPTGSSQ